MKHLDSHGTLRWGRTLSSVVGGLMLATTLPLSAAFAASPSNGTVSETQSPAWQGATGKLPTASATCAGPNDPACDNFQLTIDPGSLTSYIVTITLQPIGADDWDMQVFDPSGGVAGSSGNAPGTAEIVTLNSPPAGTYTVAASPYAAPLGYSAVATMDPTDPVISNPGTEQVEFYTYTDPNGHSFGEPGAGINWQSEPADGTLGGDNGGAIMYLSGLDTLRIRLNDCTAPATYLDGPNSEDAGEWVERNVPWHVNSLDPIIFTDHLTGRTASSQLSAKSSLLGLSDDDGENWIPSPLGAGINSGVDHQTIGGGRLAEPLYSQLDGNNPAYNDFAHGMYYCSQDIAIAQCGLSLDGGVVFGPAVPMYNLTQCSGLHGHVEVSPVDGTAYVPNSSCNGEQGIALTEDNNTTWEVRTVPNSGGSSSDPSLGIATDGTLYFGYDNSGTPYAAVSYDKGLNWDKITNVGESFGIKSTAFPEMIAGDPDRAAFAFLGSTTPGAIGDNPDFPATWHMYVAMTFDGGDTWTTTKVDPNDPVQRGTICGGGFGGCDNGTRNLLDFNDIQIDKRGRPVVIYADGCVGDCVTDPDVNTLTNLATIARLKSPKGLFAAFDSERSGKPDWPLVAAVEVGSNVELSWVDPGDGGNPITGYTVKRNGTAIASLPAEARSFTDVAPVGGTGGAYQVYATNSVGNSRTKPMCDYDVYAGEVVVGPEESACDFAGLTVLTDPSGDTTSPVGQEYFDMHRLGISEAFDLGAGKIAFVLTVQSNDVQPNSAYPIQFKDASGADRWVRMDTQTGTPNYSYGTGTDISPITNPGTPADPQSGYVSDNIIRIVVPRSAVGANVGETITDFLIRARLNLVAATLTPDNMPDSLAGQGSYTLVGSENCEVDENGVPVAINDTATTQTDTPVVIDVLDNDSDPDGDTLRITGTGRADHGQVLVVTDADGDKIEYRPTAGYSGTDSFTYTISDGNGGSATATVNVTVQSISNNNPPIARDDEAKTPKGKAIEIFVLSNDSDPDGDSLSVVSIDPPEHGSAVNNPNNSITYTPDDGFKGTDYFTYTISDGNGGTASAEVKVKVTKKDKDDDGSSDDNSSKDDGSSDDGSSKDDGSSDDGSSRDDGCSKDADCDGISDASDPDMDNDGIANEQDADDDGDDIDDEYDSQGYDEVQAQNATVPAFGSATYTLDANVDTASMFVVATGAGSEMLQIQIMDSAGMPAGTAISAIGKLTSHVQTFLMGTYTITISNPTPSAIDFELMTVRQQF